MSNATARTGEGANQLTIDYQRKKLLLWAAEDAQRSETFRNMGSSDITLREGRILARYTKADTHKGKLVVLNATGSDGTNIPLGVYFGPERKIAANGEAKVQIIVSGHINEGIVGDSASGNPNLDTTIISDRSLRDLLQGSSVGLKLVAADSLCAKDN